VTRGFTAVRTKTAIVWFRFHQGTKPVRAICLASWVVSGVLTACCGCVRRDSQRLALTTGYRHCLNGAKPPVL